jgi:chemotaxis protein MotB
MGAAEKLKPEMNDEAKADETDVFFTPHKKADEGEGPWLISYADMMTLLMGFFALIASFSKIDNTEFEKVKKEAVKYFGGEYKEPYGDLAKVIRKVVTQNGMNEFVQVENGPDGVSVTFRGTLLFDSGSFELKGDAKPLMSKIAEVVHQQAASHNVKVEGHTDNVPIKHPVIASNWELSALRAARVARLFEDQGFGKKQLAIQGWGEAQPLVPNFNADGTENPANQAKNRRVLIRIYKQSPDVDAKPLPGKPVAESPTAKPSFVPAAEAPDEEFK